jgi:hypothetical protein
MKKKVEWVLMNGNGMPLWAEDAACDTRDEARHYVKEIKRNLFEPWYANIIWPVTILRREWRVVEERKVR